MNNGTNTPDMAQKALDHEAQARNYRPRLSFYHANGKGTGSAVRFEVVPASGDRAGSFKALHEVGYDGWLVIEAFGRALPGLNAAPKIWRDLFDDALDVARLGVPFVRETWQDRVGDSQKRP